MTMMGTNKPTILMVGGWSPGPLSYMKRLLHGYRVVEPLNLPMPPFPGSWCCDIQVLFMFLVLVALLWASSRLHLYISTSSKVWNALAAALALFWIRLLVAVIVRVSIQKSAQIVFDLIRRNEGNLIVIGFSWGGAVVAEMMASNMMIERDRISTLMIAPTTSLVASVAIQQDAALRIANGHYRTGDDRVVAHVVHGTADTTFCPNQDRWGMIEGITLHRIPDNHVFFKRSSMRVLADILTQLLPPESQSEVLPDRLPKETR